MFSPLGGCEPGVNAVGLRATDDVDAVLCCAVHYGDLRRLRSYEAERLARYLYVAFAYKFEPAPATVRDDDEGARLVLV
jgi:hypothetical protein